MSNGELTEIGKYKILGQIGEGAMGVVYRAQDTVLNRPVAIKVMNDAVARDNELRARFLREAQSAGSLQHPNVVTVYDFGEVNGHLFIAMEFVEGKDLSRILDERQPLTIVQKIDVLIDLLNGLAYAHKRGIVHRDVKPANIRVDEEGRGRIMDFGIAHLTSSNMTRTGTAIGTPAYMSPEQISGGAITPASDIFSAGAVMYEVLGGKQAFDGESLHTVLYKIISEEPPPIAVDVDALPAGQRDDVSQALIGIINRALSKDPAARFSSAREMASALTEVRAQVVSSRASVPRTVLIDSLASGEPKRAARRRWPLIVGIAAALLVIVGGATAFSMMSKRPAIPAPVVAQAASTPQPIAIKQAAAAPATPVSAPKQSPEKHVVQSPTHAENDLAVDAPAAPESTALSEESLQPKSMGRLRREAADTRQRAVDAGATPRELFAGDRHSRTASALYRAGRVDEATDELNAAIEAWSDAGRRGRSASGSNSSRVFGRRGRPN